MLYVQTLSSLSWERQLMDSIESFTVAVTTSSTRRSLKSCSHPRSLKGPSLSCKDGPINRRSSGVGSDRMNWQSTTMFRSVRRLWEADESKQRSTTQTTGTHREKSTDAVCPPSLFLTIRLTARTNCR